MSTSNAAETVKKRRAKTAVPQSISPGTKTPRDYLKVAFRRKWAFIIPFVVCSLGGLPASQLAPPRYQATALVLRKDMNIVRQSASGVVASGRTGISLSTLTVEILTYDNLRRVIEQLEDTEGWDAAQWQKAYYTLKSQVRLKTAARSYGVDLVQISAVGPSPTRVTTIANEIAKMYRDKNIGADTKEVEAAIKWLEQRVAKHREAMIQAEREIDEFRRKWPVEMPGVKQSFLDKLLVYDIEREKHLMQKEAAKRRARVLREQLEG
ncbi:MAG: hypothetical protein ACTSX8_05390, partial [Alphaproteobacteria bacterium]